MSVFLTSDTHFNHYNIIKYCDRPFATVEEMNETIIENWNAVVSENDIVWHLGDFGSGDKEEIARLRSQLNGKIYLVMGNHDNNPMNWYYECGFDKVYDCPVILDEYFILSHHPRTTGSPIYGYLYGHVHNDDLYKDYTYNTFCVCPERNNYTPIKFEDAIANMKKSLQKKGL